MRQNSTTRIGPLEYFLRMQDGQMELAKTRRFLLRRYSGARRCKAGMTSSITIWCILISSYRSRMSATFVIRLPVGVSRFFCTQLLQATGKHSFIGIFQGETTASNVVFQGDHQITCFAAVPA